MASIFSKYKVWKIIRLTVLIVVLVALTDLMVLTFSSFILVAGNPFSPYFLDKWVLLSPISSRSHTRPAEPDDDPYKSLLSSDPQITNYPIKHKKLVFDATPERVSASYEIILSKEHPLLKKALSREGLLNGISLVRAALGGININNTQLKFGSPDVLIKEGDENGQIIVKSDPIESKGSNEFYTEVNPASSPKLLPVESYEVVFNTKDIQVTSNELYPINRSAENTRYTLAPEIAYASFYLHSGEVNNEKINQRTLAELIMQDIRVPVLGWILHGFLQALPFILFLWWVKLYRNSDVLAVVRPHLDQSAELIKLYLVFHAGYFALLAINDAYTTWSNPVLVAISRVQQTIALPFSFHNLSGTSVLLLFILLIILLLPVMIRRYERQANGQNQIENNLANGQAKIKNKWRATYKLILNRFWQVMSILIPLALLLWFLLQVRLVADIRFDFYSVRVFYSVCFSLLLLMLYLSCAWLIIELFDTPRSLIVIMCFTLFTLITCLSADLQNYIFDLIIGWGAFILIASISVYVFCKLVYGLLTGRLFSQDWRQWSGLTKLLVVVGIILVAISSRTWEMPPQWWPLWSLASELTDIFFLALVWLLITILRRTSATPYWPEIPKPIRRIGVLFAVLLFFSPRQWWFYIPVPAIIGYLLMDNWLLRKDGYKNVLIAEIKSKLTSIIQGVIDLNDTERLLRTLKKEMSAKVAKGDADYGTYKNKASDIDNEVKKKTEELTVEGFFGKDLVLAFGPTDSPWQNGKSGAFYSFLFSIPWLLVYLHSIITSPTPSDSYFILHLLNSLLLYIANWTAYGFFLGYFYPYIRGNNGIRKGLSLYIVLLLPPLALNFLGYPTDVANWRSFAFWQLQLLIHLMLLGLIAGDFETLRRANFRFRHLLQFYRLTSLSAWASTLIVAVGAAVTTLVSSGAAEILTLALKQMGLIPPEMKLPTR